MSANNQLDDDSRFSDTDYNRKNVKRSYTDQDHKEQERPNKKQDSKAQDYEQPAEVMIVLTYASKKAAQCMMTVATFIAPAPCLSTYIAAPVQWPCN